MFKLQNNLKQLFDKTNAHTAISYTKNKQKLGFFYSLPSDLALQKKLLFYLRDQQLSMDP